MSFDIGWKASLVEILQPSLGTVVGFSLRAQLHGLAGSTLGGVEVRVEVLSDKYPLRCSSCNIRFWTVSLQIDKEQ